MHKTNFPIVNGVCSNPECVSKRKNLLEKLEKYREKGEELRERFLEQENAFDLFLSTFHSEKRYVERAISHYKLFLLFAEYAEVVESPSKNVFVYKVTEKVKRHETIRYIHYHIVIHFEDAGELLARVVTSYCVSYSSHIYDSNFEIRHCWCRPHHINE